MTTIASVVMPVVAGVVALGEPVGPLRLVGIGIVLVGVVLLVVRRETTPATDTA